MSWIDKLALFCILGWCLSAPVSIAVSQIFIGLSFASVFFSFIIRTVARHSSLRFPPLTSKISFKKQWILLAAIAVWLVTQIPSVLVSPEPAKSWLGFGSSEWLILLCLAVMWSAASDQWIRRWLLALGISSSTAALYAIWQHFHGWDYIRDEALIGMGSFFRAEGFFDFYLTFAGVQLAVFGMMAVLALSKGLRKGRWFWWVFTILIGLSIWATYGRGAWVGAAVVLIVTAFGTGGWKRGLTGVGAIVVVAIGILVVMPEVGGRVGSVLALKDSGRLALWQGAVQMFKDHPIAGIGIGQFETSFPAVYRGGVFVDSFCHAHSDPLNRLAETGLAGILGMVVMWGVLGWMGWRVWQVKGDDIRAMAGRGAAIGLLALWVAGWSQCYYTDAEVGAVWWFMVGILGLSFSRKAEADGG